MPTGGSKLKLGRGGKGRPISSLEVPFDLHFTQIHLIFLHFTQIPLKDWIFTAQFSSLGEDSTLCQILAPFDIPIDCPIKEDDAKGYKINVKPTRIVFYFKDFLRSVEDYQMVIFPSY